MLVCEITTYRRLPGDDKRAEHLSYLKEKGEAGKLAVSGRFADMKGALIVWRVKSLSEAEQLANGDPYVVSGLVDYELREWNVSLKYPTALEQG